METVAVVSPGAMGSAMADALARGGARVVATLAHRSERTGRLADAAPLELLPDLDAVVREADVVLSIVPPETARVVAEDIAHAAREQGVSPVLVDLNAIAPATVRALADGGLELVDGSISGPPPWKPGTRVYRTASPSSARRPAHGAPELVANVERRLAFAATKSGRYAGEMHEIAATQQAAGLTSALFDAIAEIYETTARTPLARARPEDVPGTPELTDVLDALHTP